MPHTNNAYAVDRKASRTKNKPAFLTKNKKSKDAPSTPNVEVDPATVPKDRADKTALIREFHALEKQLKSPQTTEEERVKILERQEELGGLKMYQAASLHGADKQRGGETSKWLIKQLKQFKVALDPKGKEKEKVEPTILEDGTKVWPKPKERRKLKLLDVGAIAGTAYASESWIDTTSIDLNPQASHVLKSNFFDLARPSSELEAYDVVSLSLVMNFEGSLVNRGHFLLRAHDHLKRESPGYLYIVLPLPCLTNSRYLTHKHFREILKSTNWEVVATHDSSKLTHWFLREIDQSSTKARYGDGQVWKREEVRRGVERNNFCIVVKPEEEVEKGVAVEVEAEVVGKEAEGGATTTAGETPASNKRKSEDEPAAETQKGPKANKNKKRKADESTNAPAEAIKEDAVEGTGDEQKKKKAKKSKPVKGKKTVFED
ncbi:25S rRNA (adenine2142-N1)-methyltransferase [Sporobolomyces koalae]|uniref:25S rRNA (adenine2142-N1)-methyltransferase n=1 Tax=Sporobolomyces koalae TaxID=500713 RepID=UPI003170F3B3